MASPLYFCHQCHCSVLLSDPETFICPECSSDFVEVRNDVENVNMGPGFGQPLEDVWNSISQVQLTFPDSSVYVEDESGYHLLRTRTDAPDFNPMPFLQSRIENLVNLRNVLLDYVRNNGHLRPVQSLGDIFLGSEIENLVQQLTENGPYKYGSPPASRSAVESLPTFHISHEHLKTELTHCAVCKDEFELCVQVKQMPCKHMYHPDCILPWLEQHNSCPVCRYQLPTDDSDFESAQGRLGNGEHPVTLGEDPYEGNRIENSNAITPSEQTMGTHQTIDNAFNQEETRFNNAVCYGGSRVRVTPPISLRSLRERIVNSRRSQELRSNMNS